MVAMNRLKGLATVNQSSGWSYRVRKYFSAWREFLNRSDWLKTKPLNIYGPRWFHRTWDGMNQSSGCGITASAVICVPNGNFHKGPIDQWPCRCTPTSPTWDGVNQPNGCRVTASIRKNLSARRECLDWTGLTGQWTCYVAHLQAIMAPQNLSWSESTQQLWSVCNAVSDGMKDGGTNRQILFHCPPYFPSETTSTPCWYIIGEENIKP